MNSFKDASALALAIRQKEVSAAEIVEDTILRAKKSNKALNAITADRYEEALTEAKKGDFKQGIFAGVPIFLKDLSTRYGRATYQFRLSFISALFS